MFKWRGGAGVRVKVGSQGIIASTRVKGTSWEINGMWRIRRTMRSLSIEKGRRSLYFTGKGKKENRGRGEGCTVWWTLEF